MKTFPSSGVQRQDQQGWEVLRTRAKGSQAALDQGSHKQSKQKDKYMRTQTAGSSSLEFYKNNSAIIGEAGIHGTFSFPPGR